MFAVDSEVSAGGTDHAAMRGLVAEHNDTGHGRILSNTLKMVADHALGRSRAS